MAYQTQSALKGNDILKGNAFSPEEMFLLSYLKNANRKSSEQMQDVYELDISFLDD